MKRLSIFLVLMICGLWLSASTKLVLADTSVSGAISSDTTWTAANSPYIVTGGILVKNGVTLTIEPGVVVKVESGYSLQINGTLIARGTESSMITFTSNQSTPAAGDWGYILFSDLSEDATYDDNGNYTSGSILEYCIIEYAGGADVDNNGAIRMDNAHPFINHCTVKDNLAVGIYAWNLSGTLRITNSIIENNTNTWITSSDDGGGGIYISSGCGSYSDCAAAAFISNNIIRNNTTSGSYGAGLYITGRIALNIINNTIKSNSLSGSQGSYGSGGGGIAIGNPFGSGASTSTISGNLIMSNNSANYGGGIYVNCANVNILNNSLVNNSADSKGGGIWLGTDPSDGCSGPAVISDNIISSNSASFGGGICIEDTYPYMTPASVTIKKNAISNNIASSSGGGIYVHSETTSLLENSIVQNSAATASAISFYGSQDIKQNTILRNTATASQSSSTIWINGSPIINYNNIHDNTATYEIYNNNSQGSDDVNATNNWWGTTDDSEIQKKIYDWFDDSTRGIVDYSSCLYAPVGFADNLWNFRWNGNDRFHSNEAWVRPWRYDYDDGCGRWVGNYSYEIPWSETYTQKSGSIGGITWNAHADGNLEISGDRDHQWHVWTYVYMDTPKSITIPASGDCVPRCFLNYDFDHPIEFPATLNLQKGWNRIDITGYNQNSGYTFKLNFSLVKSVDIMNSSQADSPFIVGSIPPIFTFDTEPASYDLTPHEFDLKDDDLNLTWSISGIDKSLFGAYVDPVTDILTVTPLPGVSGSHTVTLTLTDSDGHTASQDVEVTIYPNQSSIIDSFTADPTSGNAPLTVTFTCQAHDPDGSIASYQWDFDGDGTVDTTTATNTTSYTYNTVGTYQAKVTVVDNYGAETTSGPVTITVGPTVSGDCNSDGKVSIDEIQKAINCFLGKQNACCDKCDLNSDGTVSIDEVQKVIDAFLGK